MFTYVNNPDQKKFDWQEIDIEMEGLHPNQFQTNLIIGEGTYILKETTPWGRFEKKQDIGDTSEWKVLAFEWSPTDIKWFVDGRLVRTLSSDCVLSK